ncbi:MAG: hypothetical protein ACQETE_02805 [Bacteroidota bacterium]
MNSNRVLLVSFLVAALLFTGCLGGINSDDEKPVYQYYVTTDVPVKNGYSIEFYVPSEDTVVTLGNPNLPFTYGSKGEKDDRLQLRIVTGDNFIVKITGIIFIDGAARESMELQGANKQKTIRYTIP